MKRTRSQEIYQRSCEVIPGGVNSPVRSFKSLGIDPLVVASGSGDKIIDADGNHYIDFCGSWGALILGHADSQIVAQAQAQMALGSSFGITTNSEAELAKKIVDTLDSVEKVRFVSSGTEATMSAIRLARGFTGRHLIVKFNGHYHGHADAFLIAAGSGVTHLSASSSQGIPQEVIAHTRSLPFNDIEACRQFFQERKIQEGLAAVILEPIAANMGVVSPERGFLEMVREETAKCGALLIFDEVITGFRVGQKGAQGLYGIQPDLTCLGKIIGGGLPAAAFGGRKEIMDHLAPLGGVYQAGTLSGCPVAMVAGYHTLDRLDTAFYSALQKKADLLLEPIVEAIQSKHSPMCLQREGSMFTLFFGRKQVRNFEEAKSLDSALFKQFFIYLLERGIYFSPLQQEANFISSAHTEEHLLYTREAILDFLEKIA